MHRLAVIAALLASSSALGAQRSVWQVGKPDHDYAKFAFAGDYQKCAAHFGGKPVVFEIGRSAAAKDWPFIQPGPLDTWSPARGKPWTIRFTLPEEPRGTYTLRIEFVDVSQRFPPRYVVTVGDRTGVFPLAPGGGDASLTNPRAGKPQKLDIAIPLGCLKKGMNQVRLACADGSWVQYDAITLLADPEAKPAAGEVRSLSAHATPCFIRRHRRLLRVIDVSVTLGGLTEELALRAVAKIGDETIETVVRTKPLGSGPAVEEILLPDSPEPLDVKLIATAGGREKTTMVRVMPQQRKWRIYVAASAHTDIGFTDVQPRCAEGHCQNLDAAIDLCRRDPGFQWNTEVAWQAENYVNSRKGQRLADFYRLCREGRIGIQALYCNELTGLCSHEEICRLTWFAHKLHREQGVPYQSAMISDVPTQEASLPMILAGAGIRYFSSGINNERAYPFTQMQQRCPCWWEGPDGSRVLMMYTWGYGQAGQWALCGSMSEARTRVLEKLREYEGRKDYPFDAVFLHGAIGDNGSLPVQLAEVVREWNARYEFPKLILSRNAEFFEYVEKKYGEKLPVYRGSAGTYWEDGAGSSARETALNRSAHEAVGGAERLLALAQRVGRGKPYPADEINKVWRNCILYDEHTWGASCSISQPDSTFTKAQWKIKAQYAVDADKGAKSLLDRGSAALAALVKTEGPALVVLNTTSWPRTDVVYVKLPAGMVVAQPGVPCPWAGGTLILVKDVPACGYRVLRLRKEAAPADTRAGEDMKSDTLENRFYRVRFDRTTGGVTSIWDKDLKRELVDAKAPFQFNQYVYAAGPAPQLKITTSGKATLRRLQTPGFGQAMQIDCSGEMAHITTMVALLDDVNRIDFVNQLTKKQTYDKEAVYFAFPFAPKHPTIRYEAPAAIVNPARDMLPGACLDWFTVQHFVEIDAGDAAITWATPTAPLVCLQDINRGKWQTKLPMVNSHIYSYAMNNYWYTNYLAGQGGDCTFCYALTSRPKADNVASARFGAEAAQPLVGVIVGANPRGPLPAEPTSLISVAEPNVMVVATKMADEGGGLIVRLWELTGKATVAHLRLDPRLAAGKATACNLVEDPQGPLESGNGQIAVPIRGAGLATVRIE